MKSNLPAANKPKAKRQAPPQAPSRSAEVGADQYQLDVVLALGNPQTGKSAGIKALVAYEPRLVAFDVNDEWRAQRCQRIDSLDDLKAAMLAAGKGSARLAYVPGSLDDFLPFCELVRAWAEPGRNDRAPCAVVVEELADVTASGKAQTQWGRLTRGGRHRGLRVRAIGHSPKEIDKTTLRFASTWRIHQLSGASDAEYIADQLFIDESKLLGLQPFQYLEVRNIYPRCPELKNTVRI